MDSPFLLKNMVANCGKIVLHSAQGSVTIFSCMQPIAQKNPVREGKVLKQWKICTGLCKRNDMTS